MKLITINIIFNILISKIQELIQMKNIYKQIISKFVFFMKWTKENFLINFKIC